MPEADYRSELSLARFMAIRNHPNDPIDGYYDLLIARNSRLDHTFFEDRERLGVLTPGQRLLIRLGTFDSQVKNGGITQFFWNCPQSIFDMADGVELLGETELLNNYERALEALVGKKDRWLELHEEWAKGGDSPPWEAFQKTYELLNLEWFDTAYFDRQGYDKSGKWVVLSRGLHHSLMTRLAEYVREHPAEFIVG